MASGLSLNIDTTKSEFQNPMVELRQGDGNYQSLRVTVTSNGEPLMLDGWTINFMGTTAGGHKIVDADVHVINASNGVFDYTPTKAWGQDIGEFSKAYFKFTNGDEAASGANFRVKVFEAVDLTDEEAGDYISVVDVMIDKIKTDMDNKLADTQTTLTNTQNQANTVQSNVNDLNTNVNELKSQNNNIKTSDNTWTSTNTFNNKIISPAGVQGNTDSATKLQTPRKINGTNFDGTADINVNAANDGSLVHNTGTETIAGDKTFTGSTTFTQWLITNGVKPKLATFTDMNQVASDMQTYNGLWYVKDTQTIANDPIKGTYHIVEVQMADYKGAGIIKIYNYLGSYDGIYYATVNYLGLGVFVKVAKDDSVVHLSGSEAINGDKAITGSLTISDNNPVRIKQSSTVEFNSWQSSKMKATRFGNIVALRYSVIPNNNNTITKNQTSSVVIPQGYRPMEQWNMAVGGTAAGSNVLVNPDGTLTSGWQDVQYAGMMTAMYFTADPFPS